MNNLGLENFKRKFEEQEMWGDEYLFGMEAMNWKHGVAGAGIIGIILAILAKFLGNSGGGSGASAASSPEVKTAVEDTPKVVNALTEVIETIADEIIEGTSPVLQEPTTSSSDAPLGEHRSENVGILNAMRKVNTSKTLRQIAAVTVPEGEMEKVSAMTANEFAKWLRSSKKEWVCIRGMSFAKQIQLNAIMSPEDYNIKGIEKFATELKDSAPVIKETVAALPPFIQTSEVTAIIGKEVTQLPSETERKLVEALGVSTVKDIRQLRDYMREAFGKVDMVEGKDQWSLDLAKMPKILENFRHIADDIEKFRSSSSKLPDELKKVGDLLSDENLSPSVKQQVSHYLQSTSILIASASGADGTIGHWCAGYVAYHKKLSESLKHLEAKANKKK